MQVLRFIRMQGSKLSCQTIQGTIERWGLVDNRAYLLYGPVKIKCLVVTVDTAIDAGLHATLD